MARKEMNDVERKEKGAAGKERLTTKYDACQQEVIAASGGWHLVLAPPGCGKTQILTERIRRAHADGVAYADMLCLTFTNRAARGMSERMAQHIGDSDKADVYVGNVHRFCSKFLFDNGIVASEASVIDEDDAISILARFLQEDEMAVADNYTRRRAYAEVFQLCGLMHQIMHAHPRSLRLHPDCLTADDITAMRAVCRRHAMEFTPQAMADIYLRSDFYRDALTTAGYDYAERAIVDRMLAKMNLACQYARYKRDNLLLDFEDLLLLTYDALAEEREALAAGEKKTSASERPQVASDDDAARAAEKPRYRHYPWIQVDEVQDLNALQLALIDLFAGTDIHTVMYLGDEQQAIFSFMGAKLSTLDVLKGRCRGHIHHLSVNHRSRSYLLGVFNTYAEEVLHIDKALLPTADNDQHAQPSDLTIMESENYGSELLDIVDRTRGYLQASDTDTTAVIVSANRDADEVGAALAKAGIPHFKVSGADLFSSPGMKLLTAHLNVLTREQDFLSWSRVLTGLHVFEQSYAARNFVRASLNRAILPSDYLRDDGSTYLQDFVTACDGGEIVVFDTETTGLNVFEDDIVQIAAVKMRRGEIVEGSALSLYIKTERPVPTRLGDIDNPIIEELKHHTLLAPADALARFLDYVGDRPLLGHNADYDYNILDNNLRRYLPSADLHCQCPVCFDSLKVVRLVEPGLKVYKLKALLAALHLEGTNSHLADDDVNATCSLVAYCMSRATSLVGGQRDFMRQDRVTRRANVFRACYAAAYREARSRLYVRLVADAPHPALVGEMLRFYESLRADGRIGEVEGLRHVADYLAADLIDAAAEPSLIEQLSAHIMELNTMKEADLCNSRSLAERVFVTTVHKAKGLEFDNVVVFDAVDGRWPNYYSQNNAASLAEDARKFYVALTRATRRLLIAYSRTRQTYGGASRVQSLTRFMTPLLRLFN